VAVERESELLSIVVIGEFNPTIFQPAWFGTQELIRQGEADAATVEIVHRDVSIFTTEWLRVQVTRDRLHVQTERESDFDALRDLVVGTLSLLRHTPTRVVGVNHDATIRFQDRDQYDNLGWRLSPRELWDEVLQRPGVALLQEQGERPDKYAGYIRVKVEPILDNSMRSVVGVNDHFILSRNPSAASTDTTIQLLMDEWKPIASRAAQIIDHVFVLAERP
jgi:hypothetical protein